MLFRTSTVLWSLLVACCATMLSGCNGCRPSPLVQRDEKTPDLDELEKKKKEKEKPKEDFEFKPMSVIPGELDEIRSFVKPGHWVATRHLVKANNFDFQAELHTQATDSTGVPIVVEKTRFEVAASRPAVLPKGQEKLFESTYFVPVIRQTDQLTPKSVWLQRELRAVRGGRLVKDDVRQGTVAMPEYQYFLVVLASEPSRYGYVQSLTACSAPTSSEVESNRLDYYRVFAPKLDRFAPLPNHALSWTSIAYVLWDDINPDALTTFQRQAMLDWLHFGGQLIINGPSTLEKLRGSFLDSYLPAKPGATVEVSQAAIDELNDYWSLTDAKTKLRRTLNAPPGKPLLSVELIPQEDATAVPHTASLLIERRIGAGRIVVTAFSLGDSRFLNWGSVDSFFNGAILRRPRRRFQMSEYVADTVFADFHPSFVKDSRLSSTLRFFSRDIGLFTTASDGRFQPVIPRADQDLDASQDAARRASAATNRRPAFPFPYSGPVQEPDAAVRPGEGELHPDVEDGRLRGYRADSRSSMAAWNDESGAANAARQALKDAAGISIPKANFVLKALAVYLSVLAPLNWLIFRSIGRVEWAWISAPLIAIVGAFSVVRMAQLDIGFARSLTEIAVVEAHGGYPHAHATRYAALYTSLSTTYELEFADDGALALPFAATDYQRGVHDSVYTVTMRRDRQLRLSGFMVPSNSTGIVHSEQILDLGGPFAVIGNTPANWQIQNGSTISLQSAGVLRKTESGQVEVAWIGNLNSRSTVPIRFEPAPNNVPRFAQWDAAPETRSYDVQAKELLTLLDKNNDGRISRRESRADPNLASEFARIDQTAEGVGDGVWDRNELLRWCRVSRAGAVSLGQLCELASKALRLLPGEARLIGWTDQELPGVVVYPTAAQQVRRTMLLVHLKPGSLLIPKPDLNLVSDVQEVKPENLDQPETAVPAATAPAATGVLPPQP